MTPSASISPSAPTRPRKRQARSGPTDTIREHVVKNQEVVTHTTLHSTAPAHSRAPAKHTSRVIGAAPGLHDNRPPSSSPKVPPNLPKEKPQPPPRFQGASPVMQGLLEHEEEFLRGFNAWHWHRDIEPPRSCPTCAQGPPGLANHRCIDCFSAPMFCDGCILDSHRYLPFHRIEKWNGRKFFRRSLHDLGQEITLEHLGDVCPQRPHKEPPITMTVVNDSGVYAVSIRRCHCLGSRPFMEQLLAARLWPATIQEPNTLFTFDVLNDLHHHSLASRKSVLDYWKVISRKSNNGFPELVPNRYQPLLQTSRFWRYIRALERSGQPFHMDAHLQTGRRPGLIAIPCMACPEPDFNMPPDWRETPQELKYIHRLVISMDANFSNQLKIKTKIDPDDIALFDGRCFYPPEAEFQKYLTQLNYSDEKSDCSNHKAVNLQNMIKFAHMAVTGILAVICRHDCFRPGGHCDLQRGERYANGDKALAGALSWVPPPDEIGNTYDIVCQYIQKIKARWEVHFPELLPLLDRVIHAIPKKHLVGHREDCKVRYSLNFLPGFGRVYGENIEAVWAEDNQQRGSLREMNAGHRHDVTEDNHLDWNFRKNQKMARSTYKHYLLALDGYNNAVIDYEAANAAATETLVTEWLNTDTRPHQLPNGSWTSVYQTQRTKAPTQAQIYQRLTRTEISSEINSLDGESHSPSHSTAEFVSVGLQLLVAQNDLQDKISRAPQDPACREQQNIETSRLKLHRDISKWRRLQATYFPAVVEALSDMCDNLNRTEIGLLGLPSDFPDPEQRLRLGLKDAAVAELELRRGQANDALENLREDIRAEFCLREQKRTHVRGHMGITRAQTVIENAERKKNRSADTYIAARVAMLTLGEKTTDPVFAAEYPILDKTKDMWMKNPINTLNLGDGTRREPWIWRVGLHPNSEGESAWKLETDRVRWFKARAVMQRWREEIYMREADFDRLYRANRRMSIVWADIAAASPSEEEHMHTTRARMAYAWKMSDYYAERAEESQNLYTTASLSELAQETTPKVPL